MLTLNQATSLTKNVAKWSAIIIGSVILLLILVRVGKILKEIIAPTPLPPPTVSFGKLSPIEFPKSSSIQQLNYSIDTITGALPNFPDRAKVFKIEKPSPDLLAFRKTGEIVARAGFSSPATRVLGNTYQWSDPQSSTFRKINVDIFTLQFSISSAFLGNQSVILGSNLPDPNKAKTIAQDLLLNLSFLYDDLDLEKTKTNLFSIKDSVLVPATSVSTAQIIEIDFFQKDIDKLPVIYPKANNSTINIFVGGGENQSQVVKADFFHQNISSESATYPIKTASDVFSQLKNGNTYILSPSNNKNVSIKNVYLGYYMGNKEQNFLMPVAVFEGDNGFIAYVSAVRDEWINK